MNPNYDEWEDFYNEKVDDFIKDIFGPDDPNPAIRRNTGCVFTDKVFDYLVFEWEVEITNYSHEIQNKAIDMINLMKSKNANVPNTASKIAYFLPLKKD